MPAQLKRRVKTTPTPKLDKKIGRQTPTLHNSQL